MENAALSVLTASKPDYRKLFQLKLILASSADERKSLETFCEDYDSKAKSVIEKGELELRKGLLLYLLNRYEDAESALSSADTQGGVLAHLWCLLVLGRSAKARQRLAKLKDLMKKSADQGLLFQAAMAACDLKDARTAAEFLARFSGDNQGANADFIKAYVAELEGQAQEALDSFGQLSEKDFPLRCYALFHYARLLERWGYDNEAIEAYEKIESLGYEFEEAAINKGLLLEDRAEYAKALRCYERALNMDPRSSRARLYHSDAEASLNMEYDERKMKQDMKTSEILAIPISDFELSVRSRNCLSKMGIYTLRDLITKTEEELLSYRNFGETSLKEIRAMLQKKGLHLGMTRVEEQPLADTIKLSAQLFNADKTVSLDQLDFSIEELNLSYRTKSVLHKMGFESLRDITMRTGRDLESNPDLSPACLQEINALLRERGLYYRPEATVGHPELDEAGSVILDDDEPEAAAAEEPVLEKEEKDTHYDDE